MNKLLTYLFIFLFGISIGLLSGLHQEQIQKDKMISILHCQTLAESTPKLPKIEDLK